MSKPRRQEAKTLADAIGMPDEKDKEFITKLLVEFNRQFPGDIARARQAAKDDLQDAVLGETGRKRKEFGLTGKDANMRHIFEFPAPLVKIIEEYYPTMFREQKHFHWFIKNFKWLIVPEKY